MAKAEADARAAAEAPRLEGNLLSSGGRGPEMVVIPVGSFRMGCVSGQDCEDYEFPVHQVTIPEAFAVSRYEVTLRSGTRACWVADVGGYSPDDRGNES